MKLVIFDCDGTIVDSQHNITAAMAYAFDAHHLPAPARADILGIVGLSIPDAFAVLAAGHPFPLQLSLAEHFRDAFASGALRQRYNEPIYPGVAETIQALAERDDIVLGIATGKSKRGVLRLFDNQNWHTHFATIQTADDHPSKPHPSMIRKAMAEAGVPAKSTIMIGDTTFDIEMAHNAGVGAIGVAWGYHARDRLARARADAIIEQGADLLVAIEAHFARQAVMP